MTDLVLPMLWQSALLPLAVALAALVAGRALRLERAAPLLAVAAGVLASYFAALHGQWSLLPKVALDWLPPTIVAGAAAAFALERLRDARSRAVARFAVAALATTLVVVPALGSFGIARAGAAVLGTGLLVASAWTLFARSAPGGARQPLLIGVVAAGAGLAMMLDSSQSTGRLGGALAATLGACFLFALPPRGVRFGPPAAGLALLVLGVLLVNAHLYAGFPAGYVALLAGALLVAPAFDALPVARAQVRRWSWLPSTVFTAVPVMVTVGLALKAASDSGGY